ncbi:hypothetical protein [Caballeronia zhejiangensis]|uniref:hypothetical protein n=1 Tax=Caballeronia zhejiangensis TaxID=871203 RepID=UPI001FCF9C87|nr:hypothetical protein [Caballeronia zhejiangensis]
MTKDEADTILEAADKDAERIIELKFGYYDDYNPAHTAAHQFAFETLIEMRSPLPLYELLAIVEPPFAVLTKARLH